MNGDDTMIEVICVPTGDQAWAQDPESAVAAARQLRREARDGGCGTPNPMVRFFVDGVLVREIRDAL